MGWMALMPWSFPTDLGTELYLFDLNADGTNDGDGGMGQRGWHWECGEDGIGNAERMALGMRRGWHQ
jgi:hypothetical protein